MFSTWTLALQSCTRLQLSKIKTVTNVLLLPVTDVASIVSTDCPHIVILLCVL